MKLAYHDCWLNQWGIAKFEYDRDENHDGDNVLPFRVSERRNGITRSDKIVSLADGYMRREMTYAFCASSTVHTVLIFQYLYCIFTNDKQTFKPMTTAG